MKKSVVVVAFLPAIFALAACTGIDPSGSSTTTNKTVGSGNDAICGAYCTKLHDCDNRRDVDTCTNRCENVNAATLPKLRAEIVSSVESCLDTKDCNTVLNKDPLATCAREAVAASAPSEAATSLCNSLYAARHKCGGEPYDKALCLSGAKLFNDDAIAEAQKCAQKACPDIGDCVDAALGSISSGSSTSTPSSSSDTPSSPSPGSSSSSSSSSSGSPSKSDAGSSSSGPTPPPSPPSDGGA